MSMLTPGEIIHIYSAMPPASAAPYAFAKAIEAATIKKLAQGVSVEPDVISEKTDEPFAYSRDMINQAVAAARVQENERCAALVAYRFDECEPWITADTIHALIGGTP